jgi:hypothetical protein
MITREDGSGNWPSTTVLFQKSPADRSFLASGKLSLAIGKVAGKRPYSIEFKAPSEPGDYTVIF